MEQYNYIINMIANSIPTIIVTSLGIFLSYRGLKKQILNNPKHAYFCLKQIDPILKNLDLLIEGLNWKGEFIPSIEHRLPIFSFEDKPNAISFAQRGHQFLIFGNKVLWFCRRFRLMISTKEMAKTYQAIMKIENYLKQGPPSTKNKIEKTSITIMNFLNDDKVIPPKNRMLFVQELIETSKELYSLRSELIKSLEKELPTLRNS